MSPAIIQIILAAMQLAPFAMQTIQDMRAVIASDPSIPAELQALLLSTEQDDATAITNAQKWLHDHPETM